MTRVAGKLGRLPNDPAAPRLLLRDFVTPELPAPPPAADWQSRVTDWPVYLNDRIGDCTCAAVGHMIEQATAYASAETDVADSDVLAEYERVSGYDPATGANDNGAVIQQVLADWRANGVGGHKCLAFAEVDVTNLTAIRSAVATFAAVDIGCLIYQGDMAAFEANAPWDVSYNTGPLDGGHSVPVVGYDAAGGVAVTWGKAQSFTWAWFAARVEEAWAVILPEWVIASSGLSPSGYDLFALGQGLHDLTGAPNPFPPAPADADQALWAAAGPWSAQPRTRPDLIKLQTALKTWAAAKGFS